MSYDDDIGRMTIGDTKTRLDLPYRCRRCGRSVPIEKRYRWAHDCVPTEKDYFTRFFDHKNSEKPTVEEEEPKRKFTPADPHAAKLGWIARHHAPSSKTKRHAPRAPEYKEVRETYAKGYKHRAMKQGWWASLSHLLRRFFK